MTVAVSLEQLFTVRLLELTGKGAGGLAHCPRPCPDLAGRPVILARGVQWADASQRLGVQVVLPLWSLGANPSQGLRIDVVGSARYDRANSR